jgi:HTH-type transcriptional regulator/antitoxin HigA
MMNSEPEKIEFSPDYASPPGETIDDLLEEKSMTQKDLAERLGVSTKHVNQVIKGHAPISADLAIGLEMVFGVPADFWMTREAIYRTRVAKLKRSASLLEDEEWASQFPISELKKRGLLSQDAEGKNLTEAVLRFFGIASRHQWREPAVAYRKSSKLDSDIHALAAWLRVGELEAQERLPTTAKFDAEKFRSVLAEARSWTRLGPGEWLPKLTAGCESSGVVVVIAEHFKDAKVNGATRWLSPDMALIQLSLRYKWEDVFWFTFFHEAGHVLKHRKRDLFIEVDKKKSTTESEVNRELKKLEDQADRFAADTLIPPARATELPSLINAPLVRQFADDIGVAPAIVVGRMQHDGLLPHSHLNELRRRFEFN